MKGPLLGAGAGASLMALVMGFVVPQIRGEEGTRYRAYQDVASVLTVCSGHTGPDVVVNKVYTPAQCDDLTEQDAGKAAQGVLKVSPHLLYHPLILAAAVSFSYNVGVGAYDRSSVARDFNAGNFIMGCNDLLKYVYAGNTYSTGLYSRRVQERKICMSSLTPSGVT